MAAPAQQQKRRHKQHGPDKAKRPPARESDRAADKDGSGAVRPADDADRRGRLPLRTAAEGSRRQHRRRARQQPPAPARGRVAVGGEFSFQGSGQLFRAAQFRADLFHRLPCLQAALQVAGQVVHHPQAGGRVQAEAALHRVHIALHLIHGASSLQMMLTQAENSRQAAFSSARTARPAAVTV